LTAIPEKLDPLAAFFAAAAFFYIMFSPMCCRKTAYLLFQQLHNLRYYGLPILLGVFTDAVDLFDCFGDWQRPHIYAW
jgi:hypothetical protein